MGVFILSNYYQHRINKVTSDGVRPLVLKKKKTPNKRLTKFLDKINPGKPLLCRLNQLECSPENSRFDIEITLIHSLFQVRYSSDSPVYSPTQRQICKPL